MKKKFKETKVGKILSGSLVSTLIGSIPIIGPIASNILDEQKGDGKNEIVSESGSFNLKDPKGIIAAVLTAILLYMALKGHISWEDAQQAKEFLND